MDLSSLAKFTAKKNQRIGRGPGSGRGKTSTRGHKGDKSRSGYKKRYTKEGGQLPLFEKVPNRGFSNHRFTKHVFAISLERIDSLYEDGEVVSRETLMQKGYQLRRTSFIKILGSGELNKKVQIEAHALSKSAIQKLEANAIEFKVIH